MYNDYETMKGSLLDQMCSILDRHEIVYEKQGVEQNLNCYVNNKMPLLDLLRKHPNWDEDSLAVIFDAGDIRRSSKSEINLLRINLEKLAQEVFVSGATGLSGRSTSKFKPALDVLCGEKQYIENEDTVEKLKKLAKVDCKIGQRTSRVIHKLCKTYGINKHDNYNSVFSAFADALNPLAIQDKAVLSLHPCDYLKMSAGDGWFSDFRLGAKDKRGSSISGTLSLLNDSVSMIFYTVDKATTSPYYKSSKISCEVFCYKTGVLLQSRLYPNYSDEYTKTIHRNLAQQVFAECLGKPNLWALKRRESMVNRFYKLIDFLSSCNDFTTAYAPNVSLSRSEYPNDIPSNVMKFEIGHEAYCVKCGNSISKKHSLYCDPCVE